MAANIRVAGFGPPAAAALAEEIDTLKRGDPLAPVTVLVPRPAVGLAARRRLAASVAGERPGVVNVRFLTAEGLAAELGAGHLVAAGRLPVDATTLLVAARAALSAGGLPMFAPVRHHPATLRAVVRSYRDLRNASPATWEAVARADRHGAQVVDLARAMRHLLLGWFDTVDVAQEALAQLERDPAGALAPLGGVVCYLPPPLPPHLQALLVAVARHGTLRVIAGTTGVPRADSPTAALVRALGPSGPRDPGPGSAAAEGALGQLERGRTPVAGTLVLNAPSPGAEVLAVLRELATRLQQGVLPERMAIAHGGDPDVARRFGEALTVAGIPFNGPGVRPLAATVPGRVLLGLLDLVEQDWPRPALAAWLATGPLRHQGRPVPAAQWDRVSRRAGVVGGLEEWATRLEAYAGSRSNPSGPEAASARGLAAFVAELAGRAGAGEQRWSSWARWARSLLDDLLGGPAARDAWPAEEREALVSVDDALRRLAALDGLDPAPDRAAFRTALGAALEAPAPQITRFGRGVLVDRIGSLVGLELHTVFVVGMAEGSFPSPAAEDPLVPDRRRVAAGEDLPLSRTRADETHRQYLAVLAGAGERVLSFARGDQRSRLERRPARWLLDTVARLAGRDGPLYAGDLEGLTGVEGYRFIPSFHAAVVAGGDALDLVDRDLRSLAQWRRHRRLDGHPLLGADPVLRRGVKVGRERWSPRFTRFDGRVDRSGLAVPSPAGTAPQSPTGLESYAACPRRYLFSSLLGIDVDPEPETVLRISPADRGVLVHRVLERYVAAGLSPDGGAGTDPADPAGPTDPAGPSDPAGPAGPAGPSDPAGPAGPAGPSDPADRSGDLLAAGIERMEAIATQVFSEFEQAGLTGRELLWTLDRRALLSDLRTFVRVDLEHRAATGAVPVAVELAFGGDGAPVDVPIAGGRRVRFRGKADRLDRLADGTLLVIDYKTGGAGPYKELDLDPVAGGRLLQLPIYALAAQAREGRVPVRAVYWFVSARGDFVQSGYQVDDAVLERFTHVLSSVTAGVEAGVFPGIPGPFAPGGYQNCRYCDFDSVCPPDRARAWDRLRTDPAVAGVEVLGPVAGRPE